MQNHEQKEPPLEQLAAELRVESLINGIMRVFNNKVIQVCAENVA